jgi:hypothetical protein
MHAAYALLRRATKDAVRASNGGAARDSDVKRRLLELDPAWDESNLGFSKFSRFLRRAHDDEVVTLRKLENGNYEVSGGGGEPEEEAPSRGRRGRAREERGGRREQAAREERPRRKEASDTAGSGRESAAAQGTPTAGAPSEKSAAGEVSTAPAQAATQRAARPPQSLGVRRGSRSRSGAPAGPPPLFEGQTAAPAAGRAAPGKEASTESGPAKDAQQRPSAAAPGTFPTERAAAVDHLAGYKGVGRRTAEVLIDAFGAERLYHALTEQRAQIRELLGPRRSQTLLTAFDAEREQNEGGSPAARKRTGTRGARKKKATAKASDDSSTEAAAQPAAKKTGARRGRRGGARKKATPAK